MNQIIRIIGGVYRGKKLHFPNIEGLRPTPDRVRETLFNWLMNDIKDSRCLDAFAGSGALGFEAFSRGASKVVFLEQSNRAYCQLQKNIACFNSTHLILRKTDTMNYFSQLKEQFDIIFLDPPFAKNCILLCLGLIAQHDLLKSGGLVYTESATPVKANPEQWLEIKSKKAGQVCYSLFQRIK